MRALVLDAPNGPLRLEERASPALEPETVLLRVKACGVCYRDLVDRRGLYPWTRFPIVLGHEIAGEVIAVAQGVSELSVGDRVVTTHKPACGDCVPCREGQETRCERAVWAYAMTVDGGYAQEVLAHARSLVKVPDGLALEKACFLHCTAAVAKRAMFRRGGLVFGETVAITGASGGVGMHAVQLARLAGARVIAITTSPAKKAALEKAGAEVVVADAKMRFQDEVKKLTGGRGADMALELTGAATWQGSLRSVRQGGRVVVVGNITAEKVELNPGYAILNEISVIGSAGASRADVEHVLDLAARGELVPALQETLPLERADEAHEKLKARAATGRLVLVP